MKPERNRPLRAMSDDPAVDLAETVAKRLDALTKAVEERKGDGGGNGTIVLPRWVATVAVAVLAAAILGLFGFVLDVSSRLAVQEARAVAVPRQELDRRLGDYERRLDRLENIHDGRQP